MTLNRHSELCKLDVNFYSVSHKKRVALFSTVILAFFVSDFYDLCASENRNEYSTLFLLNVLIM